MDAIELKKEREEFRLEYITKLQKRIAAGERWLDQAASWGVHPVGVDELKREIEEYRKELAWFSRRRAPAS